MMSSNNHSTELLTRLMELLNCCIGGVRIPFRKWSLQVYAKRICRVSTYTQRLPSWGESKSLEIMVQS